VIITHNVRIEGAYTLVNLAQMYAKLAITRKIPYEISINFSTSTMYQLASPTSKANAKQMASEIQQKRNTNKQHLKSRPKIDIQTSKNATFGIYKFTDFEEMNRDCNQSQKSHNHHSASHNIFKEIQNIPSTVIQEATTSNFRTSHVIQIKQKENLLDIHKVNNPNITKKRYRHTRKHKKMKSQRNGNTAAKNSTKEVMIRSTPIWATKKYQGHKAIKDSKTGKEEEDSGMSKIYIRRNHTKEQQHRKNKKSTLGKDLSPLTREENTINSGDKVDYCYSTPFAPHSNDESALQKSDINSDIHSGHRIDYSDYVPSSIPSSPFHCIHKSTEQENTGSDVLPQYSPIHYVSLDTYSVSIANC
jgi:hypothetical protein